MGTLVIVGAFITLADIMVFSGTVRHLFPFSMEEKCGQVPTRVVAYLVKTVCEKCDDGRGTVTAPTINLVTQINLISICRDVDSGCRGQCLA